MKKFWLAVPVGLVLAGIALCEQAFFAPPLKMSGVEPGVSGGWVGIPGLVCLVFGLGMLIVALTKKEETR